MDKVIIDKVDVSECIYYDDGTCCNKDVMSLSCENTDCIYKQLQRKEQENEKLKEHREQIYKELIHRGQLYNIKIDAYIQCLKEIKEIVTNAEQKLNCVCNITEMLVDIEDKINEVIGVE